MAVVLDIAMVLSEWLDLKSIIYDMYSCYNENVKIDEINVLDDWSWEEVHNAMCEDMHSAVLNGKIVCVKMHSEKFENIGVYIQEIDGKYNYSAWISMENYPKMDSDVINKENYDYYIQLIDCVKRIIAKKEFIVVAAGVEIVFKYKKKMDELVASSKNVVLWMINPKENIVYEKIFLDDYTEIFRCDEVVVFGKENQNIHGAI